MSTSEQSLVTPVIPEANSAGAGLPGSAPGILSPAELARMANAMFNALPDESQQPAIAAGANISTSVAQTVRLFLGIAY